jgi:hypothetical protein
MLFSVIDWLVGRCIVQFNAIFFFRRRDEDIKKQAAVRRIIDESDELKDLHSKLKAAVIMKERSVQMKEVHIHILD